MTIRVIGLPGPQGSKTFRGIHGGHAVMAESSKAVKPWREAVVWAAREAMGGEAGEISIERICNAAAVAGPVAVEMIFTWPKPTSAPKGRRTWPDRRPDIDKLCRSTFDALVSAGAIEDDARCVKLFAAKVFPGEGTDALDVPGCVIRITAVRP